MAVQVGYSQSQLVTEGHRWSQVVTLVTVKVKDISNDDLDGYFASQVHIQLTGGEGEGEEERRLIDLHGFAAGKKLKMLFLISKGI